MFEGWVWWTLLAATMQSVRTAGQKQLAKSVSPMTATLVRYLYGLPFAVLYVAFLFSDEMIVSGCLPAISPGVTFYISGFIAGVLQIVATVLLIRLFGLRNFAVGSTFVRSEILLTAIIGIFLFTEQVTSVGWIAMLICVVGLVVISVAKSGKLTSVWDRSGLYGLGAGLAFALTSLFLRQASLSLELPSATQAAGLTLLYMVLLQTVLCLAWVCITRIDELKRVVGLWRASLFIGFTSLAGSAGWFTAMTLQSASYVKTLGQIEFLLTLAISIVYFKEMPTSKELVGMCLIVAGAVLLLFYG